MSGRKTATVTIDKDNRDKGKVFVLEEMPAAQGERWAIRTFLAMARSGVQIPDEIASSGLAGIAMLGLRAIAGIAYDDAAPLLAEMLSCIKFVPDSDRPNVTLPYPNWESQVEEIDTLLHLRAEIFKLHVDFSAIVGRLKSARSTSPQV